MAGLRKAGVGGAKECGVRQLRKPPVSRTVAMQRAHLKREIVETLLFVGLIFLIVHVAVQTYRIPDTSMRPALKPEQLVAVNKTAYLFSSPSRGDVVVFVDPTHLDQQLIERVVAVPGDTVEISPSSVIVNGVTLQEPYVDVPAGVSENPRVVSRFQLRPNQYYLLNDSRLVSNDSRTFGPVSRGNIIGKAVLVFWPLSQWAGVSTYSSTFSAVNH